MRARRWLIPGCLAFWLLASAVVAFIFILQGNSKGNGSMDAAVKMRPMVEAMPEPKKSFGGSSTGTVGVCFPSGEWVVGVASDSHAFFCDFKGGGTIVVKDSRDRVRCFFGHVCGNGNIPHANSLKEFDAQMATQFAEQQWP